MLNKYHLIDKTQAATMISAFLNHESLKDIGTNYAIGGLINLKEHGAVISGKTFWYCWNINSMLGSLPKFFLSYQDGDYNQSHPEEVEIDPDKKLNRPYSDYVFKYPNDSGVTIEDVLNFLESQAKEWTGGAKKPDVLIDSSDVEQLTGYFKHHFPALNSDNPFNAYPFGFFVGSELENDFLIRGEYVRYFFGYDIGAEVNKIRIILVPVNQTDGSNILEDGDNRKVLFEQSWPPEAIVQIGNIEKNRSNKFQIFEDASS